MSGQEKTTKKPYLDWSKPMDRFSIPEYGAWRLMAELARRRPGAYLAIEGRYPAGGRVWFLNETPKAVHGVRIIGRKLLLVNEGGSIYPSQQVGDGLSHMDVSSGKFKHDRLQSFDPAFASDLRAMARSVERLIGFLGLEDTPPTVSSTIGWRVISSTLAATRFARAPVTVSAVHYDGCYPDLGLLERIPSLSHLPEVLKQLEDEKVEGDYVGSPVAEVAPLFLLAAKSRQNYASRKLLMIIDVSRGVAHFSSGTLDLLKEYRSLDGDIDRLTWRVLERGAAKLNRAG